MPAVRDSVVVVTGASSGLGRATALELARRGARVILACRNQAKTAPVVEELARATGNDDVEFAQLDLGDLASVRACAEALLARDLPIHGLINNAGLVARGTTKDGFELVFGTNHLGHYLLTRLLLDRLRATPGARIVNVSSHSHYQAKRIDWDAVRAPTKTRIGLEEYEVSKLANVLFTKELARRLEGSGVTAYAVHPGQVATDVWRRIPQPLRALFVRAMRMVPPEQGARSTLIAATSPELAAHSGRYYDAKGREKAPNRLADDAELARQLWTRSAEWTGVPS